MQPGGASMRLRSLLCLLLLTSAANAAAGGEDAAQYYRFADEQPAVGLNAMAGRTAPWPEDDKARVAQAFAQVHARAPNLLPNATVRGPLKLLRDMRPGEEIECHAVYIENAVTCGPQILQRPLLPHAIAHELIHFVDQRWRPVELSRTPEWRSIAEPKIAALTAQLKAAGIGDVETAIHSPDPRKFELAYGAGLPSVYAAKNLAEALAEYGSYLVLPVRVGPNRILPPIPPEAIAIVRAKLLAPLPPPADTGRAYNEALDRLDRNDFEGARAALDRAIAGDRDFEAAYVTRGRVLLRLKQYDAALRDFTEAINRYGQDHWRAVTPRQGRGQAAGELKQWALAIADFTWCIEFNPRLASPYAARGRLRTQTGDLDGALADLDRALAIDPANATSYALRARARWLRKDYSGARADYEELARRAPQRRAEVDASLQAMERERQQRPR